MGCCGSGGAHALPIAGEPHWKGSVLGSRTGIVARRAETRGLLRLPVRVERPRDVFNPSALNVRWVPGRRILSNATPVPRPRDPHRHPIDLKTRNATPLRAGSRLRAAGGYVA
jgi:hypothetical protein